MVGGAALYGFLWYMGKLGIILFVFITVNDMLFKLENIGFECFESPLLERGSEIEVYGYYGSRACILVSAVNVKFCVRNFYLYDRFKVV